MKTPRKLTGKKFGKLTAISIAYKKNGSFWNCQCECGNQAVVYAGKLTMGYTRSCGCLVGKTLKHGMSRSSESGIWRNIKTRCYNSKVTYYRHYGGRGITMCDEWKNSFEAFLKDMGGRPSDKHTIDRINTNGNYEPGNCRWVTMRQQQNNRRNNAHILIDGLSLTIAEAARLSNVKYSTFRKRITSGWSIEKAMSLPAKQSKGMI